MLVEVLELGLEELEELDSEEVVAEGNESRRVVSWSSMSNRIGEWARKLDSKIGTFERLAGSGY
jgi:hypothetical protein